MAVRRHIIGSRGGLRQETGIEYRERVEVTDATGGDFGAAFLAALAQLPDLGDTLVYGSPPDDITLYCFGVEPDAAALQPDPSKASMLATIVWNERFHASVITHGVPDDDGPAVVTVGADSEEVETAFDGEGNEITVRRDSGSPWVIVPIRKRISKPVLELARWEVSDPTDRAKTYTGFVNSATFRGHAAGTVYCDSILGTSRDGGQTYDVRYRFIIDPYDNFEQIAFFTDPDTGQPVAGAVEGEQKRTAQPYVEKSFAGLNL